MVRHRNDFVGLWGIYLCGGHPGLLRLLGRTNFVEVTPLEVGLWGLALVFFGGSFFLRHSTTGLWGGLLVGSLVGCFLAWGPGNFFLVGWPTPQVHWGYLVGLFTPVGGATLVGLAGPVGGVASLWGSTVGGTSGVIPTYLVGSLGWGYPTGDFKFLTLLLLGVGVVCFLRLPAGGYEPLLIGLVAVLAGLLTFSLDNLVLLYLSLELQALAVYTLVGFYKFEEERTDSALKYLLSGSLVSGFMLLAFARWYGLNGGFNLVEGTLADPLGSAWVTGVVLFKVGVAPFHFWTPLAYTPLEWGTLALTLGATKVNVWYLLVFNLREFFQQAWWAAWWAALASVVVGSIGGYFQNGVGGLLAYSGVINGGYLVLLGLLSPADGGFTFGYYAAVYFTGTIGVVSVASVWGDTRVSGFARWGKLGIGVPLVLYYLTLSLGGLPVFPGFFAKLALLKGLAGLGFFVLGGLVVASVVPAVYYVSLAAGSLFGPSEDELNPPGWLNPVVVGYLVVGLNGGVTLVGALLV